MRDGSPGDRYLRFLGRLLQLRGPSFDTQVPLRRKYIIAASVVFHPEAQGDRAASNAQVMNGDVRQPGRQFRIHINGFLGDLSDG